jgi:3-oxoacyl-[acyl-carrier-protein] synthase-3
MIGICNIETYVPSNRISNLERKEQFDITDDFIINKLGVKKVSRKEPEEEASDLCCQAFKQLVQKNDQFNPQTIDVIAVCTQNPDYGLPHTAAIVHGKLGLPETCAAFDISLGCSGYVYGLSIIQSFMNASGMQNGLLFTADPYSKIIDPADKTTTLLFGDAASVTHIGKNPVFLSGKFTFGTQGNGYEHLINRQGKLHMNGREIFNFSARKVPEDIKKVIEANQLTLEQIDCFLLHQGSKYIIDFIVKRLDIPPNKAPRNIKEFGNTVSSSIPILLQEILFESSIRKIVLSGFGVGLSWASGVLMRP